MRYKFGTDGIRGRAPEEISPELAFLFGRAAVNALGPRIAVGEDTRPSSATLAAHTNAGILAAGGQPMYLGVIPSGGVAFNVIDSGLDGGVVVSASHNPAHDNGLKLFSANGSKVDDATQNAVEQEINSAATAAVAIDDPVAPDPSGVTRYSEWLVDLSTSLEGLSVVVDHADGAAHQVGPAVLAAAGATVNVVKGSGVINDGSGAAHPKRVARECPPFIGLAFDGDADRLVAADETGRVVDGDAVIALIAADMLKSDQLRPPALVVTVMTNQALVGWAESKGIRVRRCAVGDRAVLEAMRETGTVLGGEQSGHVISSRHLPTGDGLLTALLLCGAVVRGGGSLSSLTPFDPWPQALINVPVADPAGVMKSSKIQGILDETNNRLLPDGRLVLRASGTEPLVRVMVEAADPATAQAEAHAVADAVREVGI